MPRPCQGNIRLERTLLARIVFLVDRDRMENIPLDGGTDPIAIEGLVKAILHGTPGQVKDEVELLEEMQGLANKG